MDWIRLLPSIIGAGIVIGGIISFEIFGGTLVTPKEICLGMTLVGAGLMMLSSAIEMVKKE